MRTTPLQAKFQRLNQLICRQLATGQLSLQLPTACRQGFFRWYLYFRCLGSHSWLGGRARQNCLIPWQPMACHSHIQICLHISRLFKILINQNSIAPISGKARLRGATGKSQPFNQLLTSIYSIQIHYYIYLGILVSLQTVDLKSNYLRISRSDKGRSVLSGSMGHSGLSPSAEVI